MGYDIKEPKAYPLDVLQAEYSFVWRYDPVEDAYHIRSNNPLSDEAKRIITRTFVPLEHITYGCFRKVIFEDC